MISEEEFNEESAKRIIEKSEAEGLLEPLHYKLN